MATVRVKLLLKARIAIQNDKSDPNSRPPRDGKQWHESFCCWTGDIDYNEWLWRKSIAEDILCSGEADTTGTYYGDVIGGEWVVDGGDRLQ